jgi:hypothetical protein
MDGSICLSEDDIFDDESTIVAGVPLSDSAGRDVMASEIGWVKLQINIESLNPEPMIPKHVRQPKNLAELHL